MKVCNCGNCNHSDLCVKKVPIFSFLSETELKEIKDMTGHKEYKNGEVLCQEGERSETLFIINEGKVKLSIITKDGKEQIIRILSEGEFFGELNLFTEENIYKFSVIAISKVKICTLTKEDMDKILEKNPAIAFKILKEVTKKLSETEELAQNLATNDAEIRIAHMLLEFLDKYGEEKDGVSQIILPINREEMANYTGLTRETISRKLSKLEDSGVIELKGNKIIVIKDKDTLIEYVE